MIGTPGGILLPQSTLSTTWFSVLAVIVAFNTLVYVGLTLAKLIPLPRQIHPNVVRSWIGGFGIDIDREKTMDDDPTPSNVKVESHYDRLRYGVARNEIPLALALGSGLVFIMLVVSLLTLDGRDVGGAIVQLCAALALLFLAQVLTRGSFRPQTVIWTWAVAAVFIVEVAIFVALYTNSQAALAYSLIVMTSFAPVSLAWRPSLIAAAVMLLSFIVASVTVDGSHGGPLIAMAFSALVISLIQLRIRLTSFAAISDEQAKAEAVASTDVLTGTLTRVGLLNLMHVMGAIADRTGNQIFVVFFDVDNQRETNKDYGAHYGDDVLRAVTRAIDARIRAGDLLARWGDDKFVVAGLGHKPQADSLGSKVEESIQATGVNLGKRPTTVSVGSAAGDPRQTTFAQLLFDASIEAGTPISASSAGEN